MRKKQADFYKQYNLEQLIKQVNTDLCQINEFDQDQYEDWFSQVYPLENIITATDDDPYCQFLLSKGDALESRLNQWLNLVKTTE